MRADELRVSHTPEIHCFAHPTIREVTGVTGRALSTETYADKRLVVRTRSRAWVQACSLTEMEDALRTHRGLPRLFSVMLRSNHASFGFRGLVVRAPLGVLDLLLSRIARVTDPSLFSDDDSGDSLARCVGNRTAFRARSVCGPVGRYLGSRRPICTTSELATPPNHFGKSTTASLGKPDIPYSATSTPYYSAARRHRASISPD